MKTLIVGAGIIGAIYGWAFTEAGNDVTHLVRPGKASQFADGLDIDMYDFRKGHKRDSTGHYRELGGSVRPRYGSAVRRTLDEPHVHRACNPRNWIIGLKMKSG